MVGVVGMRVGRTIEHRNLHLDKKSRCRTLREILRGFRSTIGDELSPTTEDLDDF